MKEHYTLYKDDHSSFKLLQKDGSFIIHGRNIQTMAVELYKVVHGLSPEFLKEWLPLQECNSNCTISPFNSWNVCTVNYGVETISSLGPKIWSIIPNDI